MDVKKLTKDEIKIVRKSLRAVPTHKTFDHAFQGKHIKFGYYSDPHVGQKAFIEPLWRHMIRAFRREGIEVVYCPGDNLEGMSGRPGHIYELAQIGASAQIEYATELFHLAPKMKFFIIDGN